jgi:siroheme synthase
LDVSLDALSICQRISRKNGVIMKNAQVYLIGAGPGSLELLTLGAVRAIGLADAILIDDLVNPDVLEFAQRKAQIVHVGKRGGGG